MASKKLAGLAFCISGTLSESRKVVEGNIKKAGGKVTAKVTGTTTHLITTQVDYDTGTNSKVNDAINKGVHVVAEEYLYELIHSGSASQANIFQEGDDSSTLRVSKGKKKAKGTKRKKPSEQEEEEEELQQPKEEDDDGSIAGKKICFTGTLEMKRADAKKLAETAGATVSATVTKTTDILVAGENAGSKIADAEKKGVAVWTEQEFIDATSTSSEPKKKSSAKTKKAAAAAAAPTKKGKATQKAPAKKPKKEPKSEPNDDDMDVVEEQEEEEKKPPVVKGAAAVVAAKKPSSSGPAVDRSVPGASSYMVYEDYHTKLMQTNIDHGHNNNKFYIIQIVQKGKSYSLWTRWGRLGEDGQSKLDPCGTNVDSAIGKFEKKFKDKTKNNWSDRHDFVKHSGKYQLVETTGEDAGDNDDAALGRLTEDQIKKGQAVLDQLKAAIGAGKSKPNATKIQLLSSQYYSLIPTTSGRVAPPPLSSLELVGEKEALLEFWLRMGFEDMKVDDSLSPISGVMDLPLPATLMQAAKSISDSYSISNSVDRGHELKQQNAGKPVKPMSKELYGAILLYTGNSIYSQLNAALRSGNRKNVQKYFNYLRIFIEAMGCMSQSKRTLWRGISVDLFNEYEPKKVITWWSVSSCTADQNVARNFMHGCGGACTLLTIDCKTAMDVSALSFYSSEKESLLAPGTQLEIISRKRNGLITEIHAKEVGQAIS